MPVTSMRQASYLVQGDGGATVDISLVILRGAAGGTLDNVNRWRSQLGQPAIDEATLKQTSQTLTTPVGEAVAVEIEGLAPGADAAKDGRMIGVIANREGDAWFYKMRGNAALTATEKDHVPEVGELRETRSRNRNSGRATHPCACVPAAPAPAAVAAPAPAAVAAPAAAGDGRVTWQMPAGWSLVPATAVPCATPPSRVTAADGAKGELAVTHFPGDVGGDLENVNRWRQQVGLPPGGPSRSGPTRHQTHRRSQNHLADRCHRPARSACAAGWTRHGADTWFFKLTGPDALVGAEKAKFTAFLESVRFTKPE